MKARIVWPDKKRIIEGDISSREELSLVEAPDDSWATLSDPGYNAHYKRVKGMWKVQAQVFSDIMEEEGGSTDKELAAGVAFVLTAIALALSPLILDFIRDVIL